MLSSYQQRKEHVLAEQDRGLDALHEVIIRQKHLAGNIQTEASDVIKGIHKYQS